MIERYLGATTRHRGERKARRFTATVTGPKPTAPANAKVKRYALETPALTLQSLPNVFSADRLDGGSRLLLSRLRQLDPAQELVDLACGNGVLGLAAIAVGVSQSATFRDESAMAIESARRNWAGLQATTSVRAKVRFHHGDGLLELDAMPDLVLCNPPFHQHHVVDEHAGQRLLRQCAGKLQPGGRLLLVANRHLNYLPSLRRYFARVELLTEDNRFVVWQAFAG